MMKRISLQLIVAVLFLFSTAHAATFTVNDGGNTNDNNIGDGICSDASGNCTMRAAIQEANFNPATTDIINFSGPLTILLDAPNGALPAISGPVSIQGPTISSPSIEIDGSTNNIAGAGLTFTPTATSSTVFGLNIHGFSAQGIMIFANNMIIGACYIGTDLTGTIDMGNGASGIEIAGTVSGVTIGIAASGDSSNVISGNSASGILVGGSCSDIRILNSRIGTSADGLVAIQNDQLGMQLNQCNNCQIGGSTPDSSNIVSGNAQTAIQLLMGSDISILGNYIGIGSDLSTDLGNGGQGIECNGVSGLQVGDFTSTARNYIVHNNTLGINIYNGSSNVNIINNLVSDCGIQGIYTNDFTANLVIQGNWVGTDISGTGLLPNAHNSIDINDGDGVIIGGTTPQERNVISGTTLQWFHGIILQGASRSHNCQIIGNYIGTNINGQAMPGQTNGYGIIVKGSNNQIGDTIPGAGNIISGNRGWGVLLTDGSDNNVMGNIIGADIDTTSLGNGYGGVCIRTETGIAADDNLIAYNLIAYNGADFPATNIIPAGEGPGIGIGILEGGTSNDLADRNTVRFNSIFCNEGLGINLNFGEPAATGNNGNPTPQINIAMSTDSMIVGIQDPALANQLIDVYIMVDCPSCDINPQGKIWIDSAQADGSGNWSYDFGAPIPGSLVVTATDASGNTSQFSTCLDPCSALAVLEANNEVLLGPNDPVTLNLMGSNSQFSTLNPTLPEFYWVVGNDTIATSADTVVTFQYNGGGGNYAEGNYQITLIAQQASCVDTATIAVDAIYFYVPNMITPNGDQINDAFQITTEEGRYNVEIYNRWGKRIYVEEGYTDGWQPGSEVSDGLYYYSIVDPVGSLGEFKGWVYVVR